MPGSNVRPARSVAYARRKSAAAKSPATPILLSGGNPQIAKADGDAPVQAYIAAMPGWKRDAGQRLDALIVRSVPGVRKAVRWNSPFYGVEGQGWFLAFHCFSRYIKVTFIRGALLRPLPPVESKDPNARYFHIHEDETVDQQQLAVWIKQAASIPGLGRRLPPQRRGGAVVRGTHDEAARKRNPIDVGPHYEEDRRARGLARDNPRQNAQTHR